MVSLVGFQIREMVRKCKACSLPVKGHQGPTGVGNCKGLVAEGEEVKGKQGCDLEVGKIMYPKITTLMSKKLKIMYIFQKIMY